VAPDQLVADRLHHVVDREPPVLGPELGEEHHLQEQIPQLLRQLPVVLPVDRIHHLVRLFDHVRAQGLVALLPIPRATVRRPQPRHDRHQIGKRVSLGLSHGRTRLLIRDNREGAS
jgi:hypothetical protein